MDVLFTFQYNNHLFALVDPPSAPAPAFFQCWEIKERMLLSLHSSYVQHWHSRGFGREYYERWIFAFPTHLTMIDNLTIDFC